MKTSTARNILAVLWLAPAVCSALAALWMHFDGALDDRYSGQLLSQINSSYMPYLGAMLAFYFAAKGSRRAPRKVSRGAAVAAILGTAAWNGMNLYFLLLLLLGNSTVNVAIDDMARFSSMLAWIVAPAMGFFFGMHASDAAGGREAPAKARSAPGAGK